MALVHFKRDVTEFEGYPLECDVPEEQATEMESRGWHRVKKPAEDGDKKDKADKPDTKTEVKKEVRDVNNSKKAN